MKFIMYLIISSAISIIPSKTKMDGDACGGAALSVKAITGKPLKFVDMGEKLSEMEVFHRRQIGRASCRERV